MDFSSSMIAAPTRACPDVSSPCSSTSSGIVHPHLRMDVAILPRSASLWVVRVGYQALDRPALDLVDRPRTGRPDTRGPRLCRQHSSPPLRPMPSGIALRGGFVPAVSRKISL